MQKRIIAFVTAIVLLVTCLAGCSSNNEDNVPNAAETTAAKKTDDGTFKLSYTQADSLDPFKAATQNNQILADLVFESLFDLTEGYEATTNIATGYAFTDSRTLRVDLNPQLEFSNGEKITAADVLYSTNAAMKSDAYGNSLEPVSYAEISGNSIVFHLKYADPYAINLLTYPIASTKDDEDGFPIGSGRYVYKNSDDGVVLKANISEDFNPYITTIHLVNIAAADSIDNAVNIGNISYAFRDLSADISKRLSCAKKTVSMNNLIYLGINSYSGITSDAGIRRAVSLAVDRTVLAESAYSGYAVPAQSPFNPDFKSIENIKLFEAKADTATARQTVNQSGYGSDKLKLRLLVNLNENRGIAANLIKSQLEAVGFSVTVEKVNYTEYIRKIENTEFDLYIGEIKLGDDMNLYPFFDSSGAARYGFDDKKLQSDDLYTKYLDGEEELGKFILAFNEEMPYIPLIYKKGMICYSKAMNGDMQGYYGNYFSNIDSWNFIVDDETDNN